MKAVVLAAGRGRRMDPFSQTRAKAAIPVANRAIVQHLVNALKDFVEEVIIVVGAHEETITSLQFPPNTDFAVQKDALGTADAVLTAQEKLDGDFLVVYGDLLLTREFFQSLIGKFKEKGSDVIGIAKGPLKEHAQVKLIEDRVVDVGPNLGSDTVFVGASIHPLESLEVMKETPFMDMTWAGQQTEEKDLSLSIRHILSEREAFSVFVEELEDLDKPWHILDANWRLLSRLGEELKSSTIADDADVSKDAVIEGPVSVGKGVKIRAYAVIKGPVWIGENTTVGPFVELNGPVMIGAGCRIGPHACITRSILGDGCIVGPFADAGGVVHFGGGEIGEHCHAGCSVFGWKSVLNGHVTTSELRADRQTVKVRIGDKLEDSGKSHLGCFLGDRVSTGVGAMLMPGRKVGVGAYVGPGVVLYRDLEPNTLTLVRQETEKRMLEGNTN